MRFLGNLVWFVFGGFWMGLGWMLAGLLWCVTIIGIPVGVQCFKLASLAFFPFGKEVVYGGGLGSFFLNLAWLLVSGLPPGLPGFPQRLPFLRHHRGHPLRPPVLQAGQAGPDALRHPPGNGVAPHAPAISPYIYKQIKR